MTSHLKGSHSSSSLFSKNYPNLQISLKDVAVFCIYKEVPCLEFICSLVIFIAEFYIYKQKCASATPNIAKFCAEFDSLIAT